MITDIEDFFDKGCGRCDHFATPECVTRRWEPGLRALREICRDLGLTETVKWGHPCYTREERNIVLFGALRSDFRLSFFHPALMTDPEGVLVKNGPNTRHAGIVSFTDNDQVAEREAVIRAYIAEAIGYADAGIRPPREVHELVLPDELFDALAADPALADAFEALTPGRQRSYVILLSSAKTSATRIARIDRSRDKIFAGKGAQER